MFRDLLYVLQFIDEVPVGQNHLVKHLIRGILKKNSPMPKHNESSGVDNVLNYLKGLPDNKDLIIPALSKESSGILLLPLSVRPSGRKKSLSLELRLHFKDLRNDTLGSHWACLVEAQ